MLTQSIEALRVSTGFADPDSSPEAVEIALWLENKHGVPRSHKFLIGGPAFDISFPLKELHGYDNKSVGEPDTEVLAKMEPSNIRMRPGTNVSDWLPIKQMFPDSLSSPGAGITWEEGSTILVR